MSGSCCCSLAGTRACLTCPNNGGMAYQWPQYPYPYNNPRTVPCEPVPIIDYDKLAEKIAEKLKSNDQ